MRYRIIGMCLLAAICSACGHTVTQRIGLLSLGDLNGRQIPDDIKGQMLAGSDCGYSYSLSNAARDALKESEFDTLIDVEVTNTTGVFVPSNCIEVKGRALNSKILPTSGGRP